MYTKSALKKLKSFKSWIFPLCIGFIYFLLIYVDIHTVPIKGLADQGDFQRMFVWIGAYTTDSAELTQFNWVNRFYNLSGPHLSDTFSSEIPLLWIARSINIWQHPGLFDLRVLGLLHTFLFTITLVHFLYQLKRLRKIYFVFASVWILFTLTDIGYVSYFNSGYQEPAGLIYLYFYLGILIKTLVDSSQAKMQSNFYLLSFASILLISAKAQYFTLFIPMIITNYLLFWKKVSKGVFVSLTFLIVLIAISVPFFGTSPVIRKWNVYNTIFSQILGSTTNQERTREILGIDTKLLKYSGISAYMDNSGVDDPEVQPYLSPKVFLRAFKYYLATPDQISKMAGAVSRDSFVNTISYLGYYEYESGLKAKSQPVLFNTWGLFKKLRMVHIYPVIPLGLILTPMVFMVLYIKTQNKYLIPAVFLSVSACSQFYLTAFSEGSIGVEKHLFLYAVLFDTFLLYLILALYGYISGRIAVIKQ